MKKGKTNSRPIIELTLYQKSLLINVTGKMKNKIACCLPDSRGILATMYINDGFKKQRKVAGI